MNKLYARESRWIFGAGVWTRRYYEKLCSEGIQDTVLGIVDNDNKKWNTEYERGITIISMELFLQKYNNEMIVICCSETNNETIVNQLNKNGVTNYILLQDTDRIELKNFAFDRRENVLLHKWLFLHHVKITIADYLNRNHISTVALYGLGELGERVLEELQLAHVEVEYIVDDGGFRFSTVPQISKSAKYPAVDCIIITSMERSAQVESKITSSGIKQYIYLETMIDELYQEICN